MNVTLSVVGGITILLLAVTAVSLSVGYAAEKFRELQIDRDRLVARESKKEVGNLMLYSHHWFSEDIAAWKAVQIIGEELSRTGDFGVSDCRDKWRREIAKRGNSEEKSQEG